MAAQTRILVTHGMSFLPQADHILVLVEGEITESGSYQELLSRHGAFADFIHTFARTERKESAIQRGESHIDSGHEQIIKWLMGQTKMSLDFKKIKHFLFPAAGSRRSNARLSMVDFMPFSRDLSQEQLIGWVNPGETLKLSKAC